MTSRALLLALALAGALAPRARAAEAPADTTLEGYVRSMADSTDAWFGLSAQAPDTTGLDSLRAWAIAHPGTVATRRVRRGFPVAFTPLAGFNRAVGPAYGLEGAAGRASRFGRLSAGAMWTGGADRWFGGGEIVKRWPRRGVEEGGTTLTLRLARDWDGMDRDFHDPVLGAAAAFLWGGDREQYLRHDGARADLVRRGPTGWIGFTARDEAEFPLAATASWYLTGHSPAIAANDTALAGRVHEVSARAGLRLARFPFTLEGQVWSAGGSLGGDLAYTRSRVAIGGAVPLGGHVALAPEAEYGRLTGSAPPQEAFVLGGGTLRSVPYGELQGAGRAVAHADLIVLDPLQRLLGLEHDPAFPLQAGAFAGLGAAWGRDPATGRARVTSRAFPGRGDWLSEAGLSLMYRPGLPWPDTFIRLDWAQPIGPGGRGARLALTYARALNFLRQH